jgi:polysaccharide pyruvyl transferase WcaK-like protein
VSERPLFILAGNGPYLNRGCEAIVRGTVNILRQQYNNPHFVCISHFNSSDEFEEQKENEIDDHIHHLSSHHLSKKDAIAEFYKSSTIKYVYRSIFNKRKLGYSLYDEIVPFLSNAKAVLSIGGDNYSLDYGKPIFFTALDELILAEGKPLIIWGASVGPFSKMPAFERFMSIHLKKVNGIFTREDDTLSYLSSIGVQDNVKSITDPAFVLEPKKPNTADGLDIDQESIGLNLSPLMAKYVNGGDLNGWLNTAASIIERVKSKFRRTIYLIPHVTTQASNDYNFMERALSRVQNKKDIVLVSPRYSAAEIKWIIGQLTAFAGSRTHATIASMSMGVPTLSLSYSIKSSGINKRMFGHDLFVVKPSDITPANVINHLSKIMVMRDQIHDKLVTKSIEQKKVAYLGGRQLDDLLRLIY